jgi:ABC-2 type transport system permease protein
VTFVVDASLHLVRAAPSLLLAVVYVLIVDSSPNEPTPAAHGFQCPTSRDGHRAPRVDERGALMTNVVYTRYELVRTFRNVRFFFFSLVFPLILYVLVAGPKQHDKIEGVAFPLYYLSGMAGWGSMAAVLAGGARIAAERTVGWTRQLRITPLRARTYVGTKVLTGYTMAALSIIVLSAAGLAFGVRLAPSEWCTMIALLLIGLLPFAAIGVLLGHVLTVESMGPAMGGVTSLFALLGGSWGPVAATGWLRRLAECLPSFWLVQAGKITQHGATWPLKAWLVVVAWTLVTARLALRAYRRDTNHA